MSRNLNAADIEFHRDLALGKAYEAELKAMLEKLGSIEVKTNTDAFETGNVFLEVTAADRAGVQKTSNSGPELSEAVTFAFVIGDKGVTKSHVLVARHDLKRYVELQRALGVPPRAGNAGKERPTFGYLIPIGQLPKMEQVNARLEAVGAGHKDPDPFG